MGPGPMTGVFIGGRKFGYRHAERVLGQRAPWETALTQREEGHPMTEAEMGESCVRSRCESCSHFADVEAKAQCGCRPCLRAPRRWPCSRTGSIPVGATSLRYTRWILYKSASCSKKLLRRKMQRRGHTLFLFPRSVSTFGVEGW